MVIEAEVELMDTFPISYKGKIPVHSNEETIYVESNGQFFDKNDALIFLKYVAVFEGCDLIYEVQYEKVSVSDKNNENYIRNAWTAWYGKKKRLW